MPEPTTLDDLERELADLLAAVRSERPEPDPAFAERLDAQLAAPRSRGRFAWRPSPALLGGMATAAAVVAIGVPVALDSVHDDTAPHPPTGAQPLSASGESAPAARDVAPVPPSGGGDVLPGRSARAVERSASVTLAAPSDEIESVADDVVRATDEAHGIVVSSDVASGDDGVGRATFDLRIPTDRLQAFLRSLSDVAHVRSRTQGSLDVTAAAVSASDRLADARAERQALLRALARARTANQTTALRARLRIAAAEVASARAAVRALRERTAFSSVSVSIEPDDSAGTRHDDGRWTPADAWRDARDVLEVLGGVALIGLAVALPAALVGALAWLAISRGLRRRRERALDRP